MFLPHPVVATIGEYPAYPSTEAQIMGSPVGFCVCVGARWNSREQKILGRASPVARLFVSGVGFDVRLFAGLNINTKK